MAFGDSSYDAALKSAWAGFCDSLKDAGDRVFKDFNPPHPLQRADAFRFLTQNLGQAFDLALETKDTRYPQIHAFCTPYRKLGGDAADFTYHQAWIDGASVYKIRGHRGTCRFFNVTVQGPRPEKIPGTALRSLHEPFGDIPEANLFGQQLVTRPDGSFELFIGGEKQGENWLPTTKGSRKLFIRQGFDSWNERPARLSIERVGMEGPRPLPTPEDFMAAMQWAGAFVRGLMNDWPDHPYSAGGASTNPATANAFPAEADDKDSDKRRGRAASNMCWRLKADEALIVEFEPGDSFWMATNMGAFFNSMDYLYRPVSYTPARTKTDSDGKVRLILAHDDPGYHNWMDTQTFEIGNLTFRMLQSDKQIALKTRLLRRGDLKAALPADTATVTSAERLAEMQRRFDSIRQRYGL